ncbi:MAG TPA: zf-HC2 domain-containing protein [Pyrinomonadaceae bacterium]
MNCKQIDELLPLYAGRDLDEKRARLVSEHVQICSACALVAGEYRDAVELAQHFAPPVFSGNVYASVRRQVMQQIEDEPKGWYARLRRASRPAAWVPAPLLPQMFANWFRPRITWAVASALVVTFAVFAFYLALNRSADVRPVAGNNPAVNLTEQTPEAMATPGTTQPVNPPSPLQPGVEKRRRIHSVVNRSPLLVANAPKSSRPDNSPEFRDPEAANSLPAVDAAPGESPLRVEIQTRNPNIRIIWFTQPNSKPALQNSKGT